METRDYIKEHQHQATATTVLFFALVIFGLVFWKLFASDQPKVEAAMAADVLPTREAVTWHSR